MSKVYLITGATRGLGRALVELYLARPDVTVIATARDPSGATAQSLSQLPKGSGSQLVVVKLDADSPGDAAAAVSSAQSQAGISKIDVVIANAGISDDYSPVGKVSVEAFRRHMDTNGYGTLHLIQATLPLLLAAGPGAKFAAVGSALGSIGGMDQRAKVPSAAYGPSKAVVHWLTRKLHYENEGLISFVLDPGFVQTDMGYGGAKVFGMEKPPVTTADCVNGMAKVIDEATREKTGGHNFIWNGSEFPW